MTGDLFLGGDLKDKNTLNIIQINAFKNADVRLVNLEQPISDSEFVENKCTLFTGSYATNQLKALNIDAVNLAHNHIQDKGLDGIVETINHLDNAEIGHFGAGSNISSAKKPYSLTNDLVVLGYCDFGKEYLNQITVANDSTPGVSPLRLENIIGDLESLGENKRAILYFHWGREHVWMPKYQDIQLAKRLLEHESVALIVGMHSHRIQGYVEHNGKRAYMSLGNFLFPNFYISPPTQICYPNIIGNNDVPFTRQYHAVHKITYKKWRLTNRVSLLVNLDSESNNVSHRFSIQNDDEAEVTELRGRRLFAFKFLMKVLFLLYKLPGFIYMPLEKLVTYIQIKHWRIGIYLFKFKQLGLKKFIIKVYDRIRLIGYKK
ncbi:CapA family protein [Vibrio breoganii]|uniref:CapA family protein n=1 Tax=Vibrio breoganii TaxID=553239 RepID=UPI0012FFEF1E|nr:CapA family protein [Vibrio breoganii]